MARKALPNSLSLRCPCVCLDPITRAADGAGRPLLLFCPTLLSTGACVGAHHRSTIGHNAGTAAGAGCPLLWHHRHPAGVCAPYASLWACQLLYRLAAAPYLICRPMSCHPHSNACLSSAATHSWHI